MRPDQTGLAFAANFLLISTCLTFSSVTSKLIRFQPDDYSQLPPEEYDAEISMKNRAAHLIKMCNKYADVTNVEYEAVSLLAHNKSLPLPRGDSILFDRTEPNFQVCAPRHTLENLWKQFKKAVEDEFPQEKNKIENVMTKMEFAEKEEEKFKRRMKVHAVMHPFRRLAKAYMKAFKNEDGDNQVFSDIRKAMDMKQSGQLSFSDFVDYLTLGYRYFEEDSTPVRDWTRLLEWAPFYVNCPVCHYGLYPEYVIKSDDHFEDDLEFFSETFGLEEVDFPVESIDNVSDTVLKALYSQLTKSQLDDLVEFYHVDLDLYLYTPDMFYSMIVKK